MVNSGKVTWDTKTNKVTFENLMTTQAVGSPSILTGVGVVMDSTDPRPALRVKLTSPKLTGSLPPQLLYLAESLTITLDIRAKLRPPTGADAAADNNFAFQALPAAPQPANNVATPASPQNTVVATAAGSNKAWWDRPSLLWTGAAILVVATLASNVVTWGADTEADPAAFVLAGRLAARAMAQ